MSWTAALQLFFSLYVSLAFGASHEGPASACPSQCECEIVSPSKQAISTHSVYCYRGGMNDSDFFQILQLIPPNVTTLEIRAPLGDPNRFQWNDNLNRFQSLRKLALVNCGIPALSQSLRLSSLRSLDLSYNGIDHLLLGSFVGLSSLEALDLSHNKLQVLSSGAFLYLRSLKSLSLAYNHLTELSTNLLRGPIALSDLSLDGNLLKADELNDLFSDVAQLRRLEINFCGLNNGEVERLRLERMPFIRRVGLAGNNLTEVPSRTLRALANLETVDLSWNHVRSLEPCAFCACNISRVFLRHNLLGVTRDSVHPEAFADTRIVELDLSFNHFDEFDSAILGYIQRSLRVLHLSGNFLGSFQARHTHTLPKLTHLHMAYNELRTIPPQLPYEYRQLKFLNLSGNALTEVPNSIAGLLPSVTTIDVSHNKLRSLSTAVMSSFILRLEQIYLHDNPWDCRCAAQSLQHYMLQRYSYRELLQYDQTVCNEPELLRGQPIHRVRHINDCAILFGASYGLTQANELVLILAALLVAAFLVSVLVTMLLYCGRERKMKGSYLTREQQHSGKTRLTHPVELPNATNFGSSPTEPLTSTFSSPPAPPPPPGSMFVAF